VLRLSVLFVVVGCSNSVEVQWDDVPARVDTVTVGGADGDVVYEGDADTREVFPLRFSTSDDTFDLSVQARYRGLMVAAGLDADGVVHLSSLTGLDALRPCTEDSQCATGTCGPMNFSMALWSCVTECGDGSSCPGGSTCDASTGVCVPSCTTDSDCSPRSVDDPFAISPWACRIDQPGDGTCAVRQ
jgi:hypothetical protein